MAATETKPTAATDGRRNLLRHWLYSPPIVFSPATDAAVWSRNVQYTTLRQLQKQLQQRLHRVVYFPKTFFMSCYIV